jgi:RimJ/RimL family protein N-acetyltransferase
MDRLLALEYPQGQGVWAIAVQTSGEIVGTVMLKPVRDGDGRPLDEVEVGWHLARAAWGRGYATEAGAGALRYGFEVLALPSIYACADAGNGRSLDVMDRIGMRRIGQTDRFYGKICEAAVIDRADWRAMQ